MKIQIDIKTLALEFYNNALNNPLYYLDDFLVLNNIDKIAYNENAYNSVYNAIVDFLDKNVYNDIQN
jgi:hypothetical protein